MAAAAEDQNKGGARRRALSRRLLRLTFLALPVALTVLPGSLPGEAPLRARSSSPEPEWRASGEDDLDIDRVTSDGELAAGDRDDRDRGRGRRPTGRSGRGGRSNSPVVDRLAAGDIPEIALRAYRRAEQTVAVNDPGCGLRWSLLAAIGRVETNHGRFGGARLQEDGYATKPIRGLALDGGGDVALIRDSDNGALDGDAVFDRAVGPMQFIPSTWRSVAADGNADGRKDPDNIFDAALAAAVYLCAGDTDMRNPQDRAAAVRRYNNSAEYVATVLALAARYESGQIGTLPNPGPATPVPPALPTVPPGPVNAGRPPGLVEVDPGGGSVGHERPGTTPPSTWLPPTSGTTTSSSTSTSTSSTTSTSTSLPCPTTTTTTIPDPATSTTSTSSTSSTLPPPPPPPGCPTTTTTTTTLPSSTSSSSSSSSSFPSSLSTSAPSSSSSSSAP